MSVSWKVIMRQLTRLFCSIQKNSLKSGDFIKETRIITQKELDGFSELTGDHNTIHKTSNKSKAIVHGAYLNGIVAGIIGTKFPGPGTFVIEQNFTFPNKCICEQPINVHIKLIEARKILLVIYECSQHDKIVFRGNAKLIIEKDIKSNVH